MEDKKRMVLQPEEFQRYSRHLILPEVGMSGQERLKSARVLIVGAGGLGSPVGLYLAAAGVGHLGIVDFDRVDVSNLQRQVVHSTTDVGRPKADSARERLLEINPHVDIQTYSARLTRDNALEVIRDYDIVVDGTDNFATRYLINDACVMSGTPMIYGSVFRFEGQVSVFAAGKGPCYRCLYPEPPPPYLVPSCAEGGVLGVLPGLVGMIQATETLKLILEKGSSLVGRLLLVDALGMLFREFRVPSNPQCVMCGEAPTISALIDYDEFCSTDLEACSEDAESDERALSPGAVRKKLSVGAGVVLLDVRNPLEWALTHIEGARLIPLSELPNRLGELSHDDEIIVYCHRGIRSRQALALLGEAGFSRIYYVRGGIDAWANTFSQEVVRY